MMTRIRHNTPVLRTLYTMGVTLITTLLLLVGSILLQFPGFSLVSFAHAQESKMMAGQATSLCASEPTDQHCTNQDPMVQGCYKDAQTIAFIEVYNPQAMHLARVERRYSPTCHTEWGTDRERWQWAATTTDRDCKGETAFVAGEGAV